MEKNNEILLLHKGKQELKDENLTLKLKVEGFYLHVSKLEKIIESLPLKKDSHNSSLPPSKEIV